MARRGVSPGSQGNPSRPAKNLPSKEIKSVTGSSGINIVFDNKLLGALFCLKYIYEKNDPMAVSVWMSYAGNNRSIAKAQAIKTDTLLKEQKLKVKQYVTDYKRIQKIAGYDPNSVAMYINVAVDYIEKKINSAEFYLIYYFCIEVNESCGEDSLYLKEILKSLQHKKFGEPFNLFCYHVLEIISRQEGMLIPKTHMSNKNREKGLNILLVWLLKETDFSAQFMQWSSKQNFLIKSRNAIYVFIMTYERLRAAGKDFKPLNFDNNPFCHVVYLCYLADQSYIKFMPATESKVLSLSEHSTIDWFEAEKLINPHVQANKPLINPIQAHTQLTWLMISPSYRFVTQLFVWQNTAAVQNPNPDSISEFYKWLVRKSDYSVLNSPFVFNEPQFKLQLIESKAELFVKRGLVLYDSVHNSNQNLSPSLAEIWRKKILQGREAAVIIKAYRDCLTRLTDVEFIRGQLLVDLKNIHNRVIKAPKTEPFEMKPLITSGIREVVSALKENILKLKSPYQDQLNSDIDLFDKVYQLTQDYFELTQSQKMVPQLAVDNLILKAHQADREILEHISGISRAREAERWLEAWFADLNAKESMMKNPALCQEIFLILGYIHSVLTKIPHFNPLQSINSNDEIKLDQQENDSAVHESEVLLKAAEFFQSFNLRLQYQFFYDFIAKTGFTSKAEHGIRPHFYLINYLLVQALESNNNGLRIGSKKISTFDFLKIVEKVHVDNRAEFFYYYEKIPNGKKFKKLVEKRFTYALVDSFGDLSLVPDKLKALELHCPHHSLKNQQLSHTALQAILIYTPSKSPPEEIAKKLLSSVFSLTSKESYCDSLRIVMMLKWPLALKYIAEQKDGEFYTRIYDFVHKNKITSQRLLIESIRAEIIFNLFIADEMSEQFKFEIIEMAPKYILLQDPHRFAGSLTALFKRLLDMQGASEDFLEKTFGAALMFFKQFTGIKFKKILLSNSRLRAVASAVKQVYRGKLWRHEDLGDIEGIFEKNEGRLQGAYTELTSQPPEWMIKLTDSITGESPELSWVSNLSLSPNSSEDDYNEILSPLSPAEAKIEIKSINKLNLQSLAQQIPDYLKKNSAEQIKFFDSLTGMPLSRMLFFALILGLPEHNYILSETNVFIKYKRISTAKVGGGTNKKTVAVMWQIIDQITHGSDQDFYIRTLLECFDQSELFKSVKLENAFEDLSIYLFDRYEIKNFVQSSRLLIKKGFEFKSDFCKFIINNQNILLTLVEEIFPEDEKLTGSPHYSHLRDFELFEIPDDSLHKKTAANFLNTISDIFGVFKSDEQSKILKKYFLLKEGLSLKIIMLFLQVLAYQASRNFEKYDTMISFLESEIMIGEWWLSINQITQCLDTIDQFSELKYNSLFLRIYLADQGMAISKIMLPLGDLLKRNSLDFLQVLLLTDLSLDMINIAESTCKKIINSQIGFDHSPQIISEKSSFNLFNSWVAVVEYTQNWILIEATLRGIIGGCFNSMNTLSNVVNKFALGLKKSIEKQHALKSDIMHRYQSCINLLILLLENAPHCQALFYKVIGQDEKCVLRSKTTNGSLIPALSLTLCPPPVTDYQFKNGEASLLSDRPAEDSLSH